MQQQYASSISLGRDQFKNSVQVDTKNNPNSSVSKQVSIVKVGNQIPSTNQAQMRNINNVKQFNQLFS